MEVNMALKSKSGEIQVSFGLVEAGPNTFTESQHDLALDALNNEVFVVQAIDFDVEPPEVVAGTNTLVQASLSAQSRATVGTLPVPSFRLPMVCHLSY